MEQRTAAFATLGCKINQYETEAMRREVLALGFTEVSFEAEADVYVVNTCAVTAESGLKSRRLVERAAHRNPRARIIVVGCSTPGERGHMAQIPQVALLGGNDEKAVVASFLAGTWQPGTSAPRSSRAYLDLKVEGFRGRTRAIIKVEDGCDGFCSFCVIPLLRGRSRSRPLEDVLDEARRLAEAGYIELVVSGVHLQDYGLDLAPRSSLVDLCGRLAEVPGLQRLRLSSLGPRAITPALVDVLELPIFCRHWHLPLQSGSDAILARMRRGYTVSEFRAAVAALRERFDEPAITTDVIVGHSGESEADFAATLDVSREIRFSKIHIFPFSVREGTLAAKLWRNERVPAAEIRSRARRLAALERELALDFRRRFVGRRLDVLVESSAPGVGDTLEGLADRYLRVRFPAPSPQARERFQGTLQPVRVLGTGALLHGLEGVWDAPAALEGLAAREEMQ